MGSVFQVGEHDRAHMPQELLQHEGDADVAGHRSQRRQSRMIRALSAHVMMKNALVVPFAILNGVVHRHEPSRERPYVPADAAHRLAGEAPYRRFVFAPQRRVEVARERLVDDFPRNGAARRATQGHIAEKGGFATVKDAPPYDVAVAIDHDFKWRGHLND